MSKILKKKHLFKNSDSMVLIVPDTWVRALDWTTSTNLIMSIHADDKKIIISEDKIQPINTIEGIRQRDEARDELIEIDDEEISSIEPSEY
ncbi:MAG: hypothetical protein IMZ51_03875 [Chloroflexi bacterium]|nr:hypothetical protein [Chloroflexota bacterium]